MALGFAQGTEEFEGYGKTDRGVGVLRGEGPQETRLRQQVTGVSEGRTRAPPSGRGCLFYSGTGPQVNAQDGGGKEGKEAPREPLGHSEGQTEGSQPLRTLPDGNRQLRPPFLRRVT